MKKIKVLAFVAGFVITGLSASAQKIGYANMEGLVYSLPEIQGIQQQMQKFQQDSVGGEYTRLYEEFRSKDSIAKDPKTSASVKSALEKEVDQLQGTLTNWQQIAGNAIEGKKQQLLAPLYNKVHQAITAVAKEKGYTYVLEQGAFLIAPDADNLSIPVAQRLGIKIDQNPNAPAGGAAEKPAATPAKTPAKK
ncbi:MAG TPA: OmpH family outer membrane protein [Niabella sp.]